MRHTWQITRRTVVAFYDDQMTHHAAALTYYSLISLFPAMLTGISLLGLLGQFPRTYDAILAYLRETVPDAPLGTIDSALRQALESKGTAASALVAGLLITLYGTTGVLEAARRALNVVYDVECGRRFLSRKATDVVSSVVLGGLVLATLVFVFVGGGLAREIFDLIGAGETAARAWSLVRWPAAVGVTMLIFASVYYITPDVRHRGFRWLAPGAVTGVTLWLVASAGFSLYLSNFNSVNVTYGSFAAAIILIFWLWLTNVALLFGAELNAEIERQKQMLEGMPSTGTLQLPERS